MPLVKITILEGRTTAEKHRLLRDVTTAVSDALGMPKTRVRVCIHELHPDCWSVGGEPLSAVLGDELKARAAKAKNALPESVQKDQDPG